MRAFPRIFFRKVRWLSYEKWRRKNVMWKNASEKTLEKYPVLSIAPKSHRGDKRALICYVLDPFLPNYNQQLAKTHSNQWRSKRIVETFLGLGFKVDLTDYRNREAPDGRKYDLVMGLDFGFMSACKKLKKKSPTIRLFFGTGAHIEQAHMATRQRVKALQRRRGQRVRPRYRASKDKGHSLASHVMVIGDQWVQETYRVRGKAPVFGLPNTAIEGIQPTLEGKDFECARRNFLWLASYAAVHRGLDVLLEVFSALPDLHLWVCGSIEHERDFISLYNEELYSTPNIHFRGWVDVTSEEFQLITAQCAFMIYPSASDGMPGSVLNTMVAGLIPVVTREAGIESGGLALMLEECSPQYLREKVIALSEMTAGELSVRAHKVHSYASSYYSKEAFTKAFNAAIAEILAQQN